MLKDTFAKSTTGIAKNMLLSLMLAAGTGIPFHAQAQTASGLITSSGSSPYTFNLSFSDALGASSPIGSVWYSWVPGFFYLPGTPTSASAPTGWTASVVANSIQFAATSPAYDINAGQSLSGFGYQATFTPAQLAGAANSGVSVAYSGGIESSDGDIFTVQPGPVPEPSTLALLITGATGFFLAGYRKFRVT